MQVYDTKAFDGDNGIVIAVDFGEGMRYLDPKMDFYMEVLETDIEKVEKIIELLQFQENVILLNQNRTDVDNRSTISLLYRSLAVKEQIKKMCLGNNIELFNADISEEFQWMLANGHVPVNFLNKLLMFDIEVDPTGFAFWDEAEESEKYKNRIYAIGCIDVLGNERFFIEKNEEDLIKKFYSFAKNYTCISGWNSKNFDIPYLDGRCKRLKLNLDWERLPHIDMMKSFEKWREKTKDLGDVVYKGLDYVAETYLGEGKIDVGGPVGIKRMWDEEDWFGMEIYCMNDVNLTYQLYHKLKGIRDIMGMEATKIELGYLNPNKRYVSAFVDNVFNKIALDWRLGIPQKGAWQYNDSGIVDSKGAGGFVPKPEKGLHFNIVSIDYYSLYPTIYMTHNIGVNTVDWKNEFDDSLLTEELRFRPHPQALNAAFMEYLLETRRKYRDERDKFEKGTPEYDDLDIKQATFKDLLVSANGVIEQQKFRYKNQPIYNSVVKTGQIYLKYLIEAVKSLGWKLIEADSVMPDSPILIKRKGLVEIIPIEDLHFNYPTTNLRKTVYDTEIWTDDGWADIKYVYRHKVQKKGFRILTDKGYIETTEDHSLIVDSVEITPRNLKVGDKIELYRDKLPDNIQVPDAIAWTLGLYCAEGTGRHYGEGKYACRIANQNIDLLKKAESALLGIGIDCKIFVAADGMFYLDGRTSIKRMLTYFEMCQSKWNHRKIVPKCILNGTARAKSNFLDGYLAGDGHVYDNGIIHFGSIDKSLLDGLVRILEDLGYDYYLYSRKDKSNYISVKTRIGVADKRKPLTILQIEEFDIDDFVYDIETENHHFCGGIGGILLHNTDGGHFLTPYDTLEEIVDNLPDVEKYIQNYIKERATARWKIPESHYVMLPRCEAVSSHFYCISKKSYIRRIVWDDGKFLSESRFDAKGMPGVKYNTLPLLKEILKNIFKEVVFTVDRDTNYITLAVDYLLRIRDDLYSGRRDDLLTFAQRVDKLGGRLPHDRAAAKLAERGLFEPAMIIRFIRRANGDIILPDYDGDYKVDYKTYNYYWTGAVAKWVKDLLPEVAGDRALGFRMAAPTKKIDW